AETIAAQTRARLQRRVAHLALLSLLLAGVLAGIAGYQWQQTERERSLIDEHRWRDFSRKLVLHAKDQLNRRFDRALLLTAEATRVRPTLRRAIASCPDSSIGRSSNIFSTVTRWRFKVSRSARRGSFWPRAVQITPSSSGI
ncbi:MAG: hypothetical protein M3255_08445, partial [Pseudomonadota bacterium]|nr:hypothetical protein [Pseudomonadota bacterium]